MVSQSIEKLSLYHTVAYQVCNSIVTERKNNVQILI